MNIERSMNIEWSAWTKVSRWLDVGLNADPKVPEYDGVYEFRISPDYGNKLRVYSLSLTTALPLAAWPPPLPPLRGGGQGTLRREEQRDGAEEKKETTISSDWTSTISTFFHVHHGLRQGTPGGTQILPPPELCMGPGRHALADRLRPRSAVGGGGVPALHGEESLPRQSSEAPLQPNDPQNVRVQRLPGWRPLLPLRNDKSKAARRGAVALTGPAAGRHVFAAFPAQTAFPDGRAAKACGRGQHAFAARQASGDGRSRQRAAKAWRPVTWIKEGLCRLPDQSGSMETSCSSKIIAETSGDMLRGRRPQTMRRFRWIPLASPRRPAGVGPGPDGKPLLRQAAKGLPQTAIAYLVGSLSTAMGDPLKAGWPGPGRYEFDQVP